MHLIQFREIMREAEVAHAIRPIVLKYRLTVEDTTKALLASMTSVVVARFQSGIRRNRELLLEAT